MTWPPRQPPRSEIAEDELAAFDRLIERRRAFAPDSDPEHDAGYYGRLLTAPTLAALLSDLGGAVRRAGERPDTFSHAQRELVDQVLSVDLRTNVVQRLHVPDALAAGVRREAIGALRSGDETALTAEERELAAFIRAVVRGDVDERVWAAAEVRLGERGAVEYAIFVLFLQLTMRLQQAVGMPDPPDAEIDALLARIDRGEQPLPDHRRRLR